ncbi:MAG: TetR/AcrR family transcriptional regulator [Scytonematopsis contorta HA4267-MV1]|jgi:AcrR family transcriptional regulator|nr:TetR/AcrR family transcriptional regulator [Scytonematopsis contorta HA4267-MV1]
MSIKEKVLQVSDQLFAQEGYKNVPMSTISSVSKVSIGSIYHAFKGGKEEIAHAILENYFNDLISSFNQLLNQDIIDLSLDECVKKLIQLFTELNSRYQSSPELQKIVKNQKTRDLAQNIRQEIISKFALFLRLKIPNLTMSEANWKSRICYVLCDSIFDEWESSHEEQLLKEMEVVVINYLKCEGKS